jgi:predicted amidophosphoribosyltransferase
VSDPAAPPPPPALKCPVCTARFRDRTTCPRCGTDLSALMRVAARAWTARQRCRHALLTGDLAAAFQWSAVADRLHARGTPAA